MEPGGKYLWDNGVTDPPIQQNPVSTSEIPDNDVRKQIEILEESPWKKHRPLLIFSGVVLVVMFIIVGVTAGLNLDGNDQNDLTQVFAAQAKVDASVEAIVAETYIDGSTGEEKLTFSRQQMVAAGVSEVNWDGLSNIYTMLGTDEDTGFDLTMIDSLSPACSSDSDCNSINAGAYCNVGTATCVCNNYYEGRKCEFPPLGTVSYSGDDNDLDGCPDSICYSFQSAPSEIKEIFAGFPTRRPYVFEVVTDSGSSIAADSSPDDYLDNYLPSTSFYAKMTILDEEFEVQVVFFVSDIQGDDSMLEVALRLELDLEEHVEDIHFMSRLPILNDIPDIDQLHCKRGAVVLSSADYDRHGYQIGKGFNIATRVHVHSEGALGYVERFVSPKPGNYTFFRGFAPHNVSESNENIFSFEYEPNIKVKNGINQLDIARLGFSFEGVDDPDSFSTAVSARVKLSLSDDTYVHSWLAGEFAKGAVTLSGQGYKYSIPAIEDYVIFHTLGVTIESTLFWEGYKNFDLDVDDFEFIADATITALSPYNPRISIRGKVSRQGFALDTTAAINEATQLATIVCDLASEDGACSQDAAEFIDDLNLSDLQFYASIATAPTMLGDDFISKGITLYAQADFTLPDVATDLYDALGMSAVGQARVGAYIPFDVSFFDDDTFKIYFMYQNDVPADTSLQKTIHMDKITLQVKPTDLEVSMVGEAFLNVPGVTSDEDQQLRIEVEGGIQGASVFLGGSLIGTWHDVGGVKGLKVEDLHVSAGLSILGVPTFVELWGTIDLYGTGTHVDVTMICDPSDWHYYLEMHIVDLSMGNIVEFIATSSGLESRFGIDLLSMVGQELFDVEIHRLDVHIAPVTFIHDGVQYESGFYINGTGTILNADVQVYGNMNERDVVIEGQTVTINDIYMDFFLDDLNLLELIPFFGFADYVLAPVQEYLEDLGEVCLPSVCLDPVCVDPVCVDPVCVDPICTDPVCVDECEDICSFLSFGLKSCDETCVTVCVPKTRTCVGTRTCIPEQTVCVPEQTTCSPAVCTPSDICGTVPLAAQAATLVETFRDTLDGLFNLRRLYITGFSVHDFIEGIMPKIEIELEIGNKYTYTYEFEIVIDFFIADAFDAAIDWLKAKVQEIVEENITETIQAVVKEFCTAITDLGCITVFNPIEAENVELCIPDFCSASIF